MKENAIIEQLNRFSADGKRMFISSSFQTHSIPLLHIISRTDVLVDVLFINTGFHFPETLRFRDLVASDFNLNVIDISSVVPKNLQRDIEGNFFFISDPDRCCFMNKTQPMEAYLQTYDIWINGVRADQNANRASMKVYEKTPHKCVRYHPVLDWSAKDIFHYRKLHNLPAHPLEDSGFISIGCQPCTRKYNLDDERSARWYGMNKTECGLHTDLIKSES
ncbi:MAG: phosphoadenylyl-sulfate reductase [Chitinophagales bacterium]|nr:phosphoadenylyl-sulfate reductase [Chitinophagales bacterium]